MAYNVRFTRVNGFSSAPRLLNEFYRYIITGRKKWICPNLLMANMSQKCENCIRNKSGVRIVNATFAYGFYMGLL